MSPELCIGTYLPWIKEAPLANLADGLESLGLQHTMLHALPFLATPEPDVFAFSQLEKPDRRLGTMKDVRDFLVGRVLMLDLVLGHTSRTAIARHQRPFKVVTLADLIEASPGTHLQGRSTTWKIATKTDSTIDVLQTFGPEFVDIDLLSLGGEQSAERITSFVASFHPDIIRLDAAAYYAKSSLNGSPHQGNNAQLVEHVCRSVRAVMPTKAILGQFDCDAVGRRYLRSELRHDGCDLVYDYSYSALSIHAIATGDVAPLIAHLNSSAAFSGLLVRAPRTHDGIYLGSDLLPQEVRVWYDREVPRHDANYRTMTNGHVYEANWSLPWVCEQASDSACDAAWRVCSAHLIALSSSAIGYAYLPALLMQTPELRSKKRRSPRDANREKVSESEFWVLVSAAQKHGAVRALLETVDWLRTQPPFEWAITSPSNGVIAFEARSTRIVINLSSLAYKDGASKILPGHFELTK